jgi:hypothetical protein
VLAWVWLDMALATLRTDGEKARPFTVGKLGAARYFFHYELPKIGAWLQVVASRDLTFAELPEQAF